MLSPHKIWKRVAATATLAVPALLMVAPNAFAMPEGQGRAPSDQAITTEGIDGAIVDPIAAAEATSQGFDWSGVPVLAALCLAALVAVFALRHADGRRGRRSPAR